jgi:hypothetical protein
MSVDSETVVVGVRGLTYNDLQVQASVLITGPLIFLFVLFLTVGGPADGTALKLAVAALAVVVTEVLLEGTTSVRRVEVSPAGVRFRYIFHTERASWTDLSPTLLPAEHGMWQVVRFAGKGGRLRAYRITTDMARAILRFPARPRWDIPLEVWQSMGLEPV